MVFRNSTPGLTGLGLEDNDNVLSLARLDRFYCFKHHLNIFRSSFIIPVGFTEHCMIHC